jgi:hypothetical protein
MALPTLDRKDTAAMKAKTLDRADVLRLAERAQRMGGEAHRRGDYLATARLMDTARRYRALAYELGARA